MHVPDWLHLWFVQLVSSNNFQQVAPLVVLIGVPTLTFFAASTIKRSVLAVSAFASTVIMSVGLSLRWLLPWSSSSSGLETELGEVGRSKTKRRSRSMSSPTSPGKERKKIRKGVRTRAEQVKALNGSARSHDSVKLGEDDGYFPGLVNISGTYCFMNSTLQALASLSYLQPHIDAIHAKAEALDVPTPVVDALKDLFRELNTPRSSYHSLRPLAIIQVLSSQTQGRTNSLFYSREHQDAQELFQVVSECIKNEIAAVDKEGARDRGFGALAAGPVPPEATFDIGKSVFDGLTANRRSCVICGYTEAVMHFAFDNWQLTVPRLAAACRLEDCLEDYTRLEILKDCICRKCSLVATHTRLKRELATLTAEVNKPDAKPSSSKKKRLKDVKKMEARVQAALDEGRIEDDLKDVRMEKIISSASTKQAMIARPPPVLALHLNRSIHYGHYASKNNCRVVFPEVLDLTAYTTSGSLSTIPTAAISTPPPAPPPPTSSARHTKSRSTTPTPSLYHGQDGGARGQRTIYRLSAVVCHFGSHSFGHYISYRRKPRPLSAGDEEDGEGEGERVWGFENPKLVDPLYSSLNRDDEDEDDEPPANEKQKGKEKEKGGDNATTGIEEDEAEEEEDLEPRYTFADTPTTTRPGTGWLRISDDSVRECGIETVLAEGSSSVFMLYYELAVHDRRGVYAYQSQSTGGASSMMAGGANGVAVVGASEETLKPQVRTLMLNGSVGSLVSEVGVGVRERSKSKSPSGASESSLSLGSSLGLSPAPLSSSSTSKSSAVPIPSSKGKENEGLVKGKGLSRSLTGSMMMGGSGLGLGSSQQVFGARIVRSVNAGRGRSSSVQPPPTTSSTTSTSVDGSPAPSTIPMNVNGAAIHEGMESSLKVEVLSASEPSLPLSLPSPSPSSPTTPSPKKSKKKKGKGSAAAVAVEGQVSPLSSPLHPSTSTSTSTSTPNSSPTKTKTTATTTSSLPPKTPLSVGGPTRILRVNDEEDLA